MRNRNNNHKERSIPVDIHEHQSAWLRFFSSQKFVALLAISFLILLSFPLAKSYSKRLVVEKEIDALRLEIDKYEKSNQELYEMLDYISSPQAAEDQGRMTLNLKKDGEGVVLIERSDVKSEEDLKKEELAKFSNWKLWWLYFFD